MFPLRSCDTFAILPPGTADNCVVFAKNSDRRFDEVQEVVYIPAIDHPIPSKLKCTYIEIEQVPHTYATVLSKPAWMWGAEMGSNEHGVCIGSEAVWTKLNDDIDSLEKLFGMDLLRLALERAKTALEALHTIVSLIGRYGMGGTFPDNLSDFVYLNSFLIADPMVVWVLECAGSTIWAAEKITKGVRNISNELSIRTKIDLSSENLESYAIEKGFWSSDKGPLNFKAAFGYDDDESNRYKCGKSLLKQYSKDEQFKETDMFKVLRDKPSGICISSGPVVTTGSQVSVLRKPDSGLPCSHWFTATPDPCRSVFKPFIFTDQVDFPSEVSSIFEKKPNVDMRHGLYVIHQQFCEEPKIEAEMWRNKIKGVEEKYVAHVKEVTNNFVSRQSDAARLFKDAVEDELKIYG